MPRSRSRFIRATGTLTLTVLALVACSGTTTGHPVADTLAPTVDLQKLDVGRYSTEPNDIPDQAGSDVIGRRVEAFRMSDVLVDPYEIEKSMVFNSTAYIDTADLAANSLSGLAEGGAVPGVLDAFRKYGFVTGFQVFGTSVELGDGPPPADFQALSVVVSRFPDDDAARQAAVDIDRADFEASNLNEQVQIPNFPQAWSHWRPGLPSMAATMAKGPLVISTFTRYTTPNKKALSDRLSKVLETESALIDKFTATPIDQLSTLNPDPDGIVRLALNTTDKPQVDLGTVGWYGAQGSRLKEYPNLRKTDAFKTAGVDRVAEAPSIFLYRAKDYNAALNLRNRMVDADEYLDRELTPPEGVTDIRCFEQKPEVVERNPDLRFFCYLTADRFVASTQSGDEQDVQQRAAAQYAVIINGR